MKANLLLFVFVGFFQCVWAGRGFEINKPDKNNSIGGKWVRLTQSGPVGMEFTEEGKVEVDFGIDGTVDVVS
ncbi:MAG TPA: hypothetical protein ENN90_02205, partial [Mariniphaga anaerophila]|nr:hypothetical protein [Mariniphaga anaerophila]